MFPWQHYIVPLRKILNFDDFGCRTAHPIPLGFNVSSNATFRGQLKLFFPLGLEVMTVQRTILHCLRTDNFICSSQTGVKTPKTLPNELVETGVFSHQRVTVYALLVLCLVHPHHLYRKPKEILVASKYLVSSHIFC